jgi:hypothetical protein
MSLVSIHRLFVRAAVASVGVFAPQVIFCVCKSALHTEEMRYLVRFVQ